MDAAAVASDLHAEAAPADKRRVLVLAGDRDVALAAALDAVATIPTDESGVTVVSDRDGPHERVAPDRASELLGTTRDAVVLDCYPGFRPNALGALVGAVAGGGLLVLVTPALDAWPDRRDNFDEGLAVPPYGIDQVAGNFRSRFVRTLRQHPGVAVVDVDADEVRDDGLTGASTTPPDRTVPVPRETLFPTPAFAACLTADQSRAVQALEALREPGRAVVVESDRGRGKSSAAGLAAGCLALDGADVLVTAPARRAAAEVFARAEELLADLDSLAGSDGCSVTAESGGRIRFRPPTEAVGVAGDVDAVVVDEAAGLPVHLLEGFLDAQAVAFCTTVHGYEGAGRSFDVRFRSALEDSGLSVTDVSLEEPIRYARGDPVEAWAFRALLLDARPPVAESIADATPETVRYRSLTPADLLADEHRLREAFGLLVLAHYRTEPNDLARLLDAPNLRLRVLCHDGHVVSVALLAREGGLDPETRRAISDGQRIRGNMLPDVFTSQLRDPDGAVPVGYRVMRIATHHAVRSTGLGSRLLAEVREEFADPVEGPTGPETVDYLGVGYGATPELVRFWAQNGYGAVHLSTTRNETSGEYSVLMVDPLTDAGRALHDRHARWFAGRAAGVLADPLRDADPDVVRATLGAVADDAATPLDLSDRDWRVVVDAAYGPGLYVTAPRAFQRLALHHLVAGDVAAADASTEVDSRAERLLVAKVLQARPWEAVADDLGFVSRRAAMKALGEAYQPLVDRYGTEVAHAQRRRYTEGD